MKLIFAKEERRLKSLVSILVPIFNMEKYLNKCLDSLVNQTLKDIEIILINDGSTDDSFKIINDYAKQDERIKIINKENTGYGASMNMGLDFAQGKYIGIVEPDDFVSINMFEKLSEKISKYDCDLVKSDFYICNSERKQKIKFSQIEKYKTNEIINAKTNPEILKLIPSIWSAVYKKDFLIKNNIRFLETPGASFQDTSFSIKTLMNAEKLMLIPDAYLFYNDANNSSSTKNKGKIYFICKEFEEIHRYIDENQEFEIFRQIIFAKQFKAYCWNFSRLDSSVNKEFFDYFYNQYKKYYDDKKLNSDFYTYIKRKKDFDLFINKPEKFYKKLLKENKKYLWNDFRRNLFSIRISSHQVSVVLFGKQIVRIN